MARIRSDSMFDAFSRLYHAVVERRHEDPATSRTAKLFADGRTKIAKKVAEEAVEVALEAMRDDRARAIEESADLVYNLSVLWADLGITPAEVMRELERREQLMGIAEKLPKSAATH